MTTKLQNAKIQTKTNQSKNLISIPIRFMNFLLIVTTKKFKYPIARTNHNKAHIA